MLDGLHNECSIAKLCRREWIAESLYHCWSKEFLEAGKRRPTGDAGTKGISLASRQILQDVTLHQVLDRSQDVELCLIQASRRAYLPLDWNYC